MKIAILIPCLNEEITIGKVISDFRKELPDADIYVFDNNSTDNTVKEARKAGSQIRLVKKKGKGHVVVEMFRSVEADYYVMVDGDDTYPSTLVKTLLKPVLSGECDMSVGYRVAIKDTQAFPTFHKLGNSLITHLINFAFKSKIKDVFSGYRVFSKKLVLSLPLLSKGFEIETELTLQALDKGFEICEIDVPYQPRPEGSKSKLNTFSDGMLVIKTILTIIKDYKPLMFFLMISILFFLCSLGLGSILIIEYLQSGLVTNYSTGVLSTALMVISMLSFTTGLILDTHHRRQSENYVFMVNQMIRSSHLS